MDSMKAFAMGAAAHDRERMVFDWDKAARRIKETGAREASAGLASDWEWTGGDILSDGSPVHESYTYLASTWATPELELDGVKEDCFVFEGDGHGWDEKTKWPQSALDILTARALAAAKEAE